MTVRAIPAAHHKPEVVDRVPQARCHACGSPAIVAVCSQCHRLLCPEHDELTERAQRRGGASSVLRRLVFPEMDVDDGRRMADDVDRARGSDGDRDPPKRVLERHHCSDCRPLGGPHDAVMLAASALLVLGVTLAIWRGTAGLVLISVAVIGAAWRSGVALRRRRRQRPERPPLVLNPRVAKLELVENCRIHIERDDDDHYRTTPPQVGGEVRAELVWARAHAAQVLRYRQRHRLADDEDFRVSAGALILRGPARVVLKPTEATSHFHATGVLLRPSVRMHPLLRDRDGRGDPRWRFELRYRVFEPENGWPLHLWVTVAIAPESDRRALDLELQWRTRESVDHTVTEVALLPKKIEKFAIQAPAEWGEIRGASPGDMVITSSDRSGARVVEWTKPELEPAPTSRGRYHFSIGFENRIVDEAGGQAPHIKGSANMMFDRTLSGAERVQLHAPGGGRRQDGQRATVGTRVGLTFDLSLAAARYQDVRAVPDPARDGDDHHREHQTFDGVVPDHHTVAQLTGILSSEGYYVKRVVENPPQAGRAADVLNRFWDIAGRKYRGVHPIDFHLVLTGEEVQAGSSALPSTTARLTVRGIYADERMEQDVVSEHENLWARIESSLAAARTGADGGHPRAADEPIDAASSEVARLRNVAISVRSRLLAAREDGHVADDLAADLVSWIDDEFGVDDRAPGRGAT